MKIERAANAPQLRGWDLTVRGAMRVDGALRECAVSAEALEDHCGAPSLNLADLLAACAAHRTLIEQVARHLLHSRRHRGSKRQKNSTTTRAGSHAYPVLRDAAGRPR